MPGQTKAQKLRSVGRPPASQGSTLFTPLDLMEIERMYLQNVPARQIAAKFGVHKNAIDYQITKHIRPEWKKRAEAVRDEEQAKVDLLERIAWERFEASKSPEERETIESKAIAAGADPKVVKKVLTKIGKNGEACWLQVVQWCLDWRARIRGDYASQKHEHKLTGDLRVAGTNVEEFTQETLAELLTAIKKRRNKNDSIVFGS